MPFGPNTSRGRWVDVEASRFWVDTVRASIFLEFTAWYRERWTYDDEMAATIFLCNGWQICNDALRARVHLSSLAF